jgi:glycerophosphoryl diester phosphodiesterase
MNKIFEKTMPQFDDHFIEAHRGASGGFPENTMRAFLEAAAAGARSIETDLSLLADDSFAIFHDPVLGRTVTGDGEIGKFDGPSLGRFDAGSWRGPEFASETIPALADVLKWQRDVGIGFNWEVKPHVPSDVSSDVSSDALDDATCHAALYQRHANAISIALENVDPALNMISSFDAGFLAKLKMPKLARALIAEKLPEDWRDLADKLGIDGYHLNHAMLSKDQVEAVHQAGLAVRCYTVNERADIERLIDFGVDMVMTDWPERFIDFDKSAK